QKYDVASQKIEQLYVHRMLSVHLLLLFEGYPRKQKVMIMNTKRSKCFCSFFLLKSATFYFEGYPSFYEYGPIFRSCFFSSLYLYGSCNRVDLLIHRLLSVLQDLDTSNVLIVMNL